MVYGRVLSLILVFLIYPPQAQAQELYRVPWTVQTLGDGYGIARQLEIQSDPNATRVGLYVGVLAAADVLAQEIASKRGAFKTSIADWTAAFWVLCFVPPNKPPPDDREPEERASLLMPAYYEASFREKLGGIVGQGPVSLAKEIDGILRGQKGVARLAFDRGSKFLEALVAQVPNLMRSPSRSDFDWEALE